jgi:hypothetical protein
MGQDRHTRLPLVPRHNRNLLMLTDCSKVTPFWGRLTKTLYALIGPHPLHKKQIRYGYTTLDTTPQQLANYLLALAKTTIYKTYLATNNTHTKPPDYQRMFRIRLLFRLHLEMNYSTWKDDVEKFKSYWLQENILGRLQEGRILLTEQV